MLQFKEKFRTLGRKVRSFAQKSAEQIKPYAAKALRFTAKHRIPTTVVCVVLVLSMLMSVITVSIHQVDVIEDGEKINSFHAILTDEQSILEKAEITLSEGDEMTINEDGGVVTVQIARAFPVYIHADGETAMVMLAKGTVADALEKAELTCGEEDLLSVDLAAALESGMEITLDRVKSEKAEKTVSIDFETKKVETKDLYVGETKVQQKGEKGEKKLTYSVTYTNGKETDRKLVSEEIVKEPVEKIVLVGTKPHGTFLQSSSAPKTYKKVMTMNCTAYSAGGSTATGRPAKWGVIAVDPKVIPLGTKVYVETTDGKFIYGTAIAADTGGAIKGNIIDICVNTRKEAYAFGRRTVNVYIL